MKKVGNFLKVIFGFEKNSKYVDNYLHEQNGRSGAFFGAIIVLLELALIIRQSFKYFEKYGDNPTFAGFINYISIFVLFLLVGLSLCLHFTCEMHPELKRRNQFLLRSIPSDLTFLFTFYIFAKENYQGTDWSSTKGAVLNLFLIIIYVSAQIISLAIIFTALKPYLKEDGFMRKYIIANDKATNVILVVAFAVLCTSFGMRVSFADHIRSYLLTGKITSEHNEIICFLSMSLFVAVLLIWRPWITILVNFIIFFGFFMMLKAADAANIAAYEASNPGQFFSDHFTDGDTVNYFTFYVSLVTISTMIYHQRRHTAVRSEELLYNAEYDELSGLNNYKFFTHKVREYIDTYPDKAKNKTIIYINLNGFSLYNDQKGFSAGNKYLRDFGQALKKEFNKEDDYVCRQHADFFVVFTTKIENSEEEALRINELAKTIDPDIPIEVDFGIYRLNGLEEKEDVRRMVDKARYACHTIAKERNKITAEYDMKMHKDYHLRQYIIHNVDKAIENGWIVPYYQPVVDSKTSELVGFEALARWIDPTRGFLSPASFIPVLENVKLIHKVDTYIIKTVCLDMAKIIHQGKKIIPVSINFSRADFEAVNVTKVLDKMIAKYNVPKTAIHVEVTESALAKDPEIFENNLLSIKKAGYPIWLDDFGSGYSSLTTIKDYDFDVIKLDMAFLKNFSLDNKKATLIIKSILQVAKTMGLGTVAEGVETKEQQLFLAENGCQRLQGYLFGKPSTIEEISKRIENGELVISNHIKL